MKNKILWLTNLSLNALGFRKHRLVDRRICPRSRFFHGWRSAHLAHYFGSVYGAADSLNQ